MLTALRRRLTLLMTALTSLVLAGALVLFRRKFVLTDARAVENQNEYPGDPAGSACWCVHLVSSCCLVT